MSRISIKPLVDCQWGQYAPYYNKLKYNGKYQLVGCTALAVAQIAYYWMIQRGFHRGCKATSKYTTSTNKFEVAAMPPITVFDWKNIVAKPKTTEQKNAVATLCEYIAKALKSDFARTGTAAKRTSVATVINNTLRLGASKQVYQATVGKTEFENIVYNELANDRPVYMSATSDGGHSYVIDGYDAETGKYHVNWGFDGKYDGYYSLNSMILPDKTNYNGSKMAVVNIMPTYILGDVNGDGIINISDVVSVVDAANKGTATKQNDINADGKVTVEDAEIIVEHLIKGDVL